MRRDFFGFSVSSPGDNGEHDFLRMPMDAPGSRRQALAGLLCCAIGIFAGCSGSSALDASDAGKSASYQPGTASFDIEAAPMASDSVAGFDLYISIPPPSLTFMRVTAGFRAVVEISVRLSARESGDLIREQTWAETTLVARYERTQQFDPVILTRQMPVDPGRYALDVTLEDMSNGQKAARAQSVTVMDPGSTLPAIGRVMLQSRRFDERYMPEVSFHLPFNADSLRLAVDVYNVPPGDRIPVDVRILKFKADTAMALPPYAYSALTLPVGYGLVDFDRADTVYTRPLSASIARRRQTLILQVPRLQEGLFRFDIQVKALKPVGGDTSLVAERFYSLKSAGFPRPVTLHELIESAGYIATDKEMHAMTSAATPEEQRAKFEAFWLNFVNDKGLAASLIRRYYTRVEEANRLFTTVREGWRTDRGMVYIVMGPPGEIMSHLDMQTWYFNLPGNQMLNTYTFKRVIRQAEGLSVEEYVLLRQTYYELSWDRMVAKWRSGEGL